MPRNVIPFKKTFSLNGSSKAGAIVSAALLSFLSGCSNNLTKDPEVEVVQGRSAVPFHIVQEGESLNDIAALYHMDQGMLRTINRLDPADIIIPGQRLVIHAKNAVYPLPWQMMGTNPEAEPGDFEEADAYDNKDDEEKELEVKSAATPPAKPATVTVSSAGLVWPFQGSITKGFTTHHKALAIKGYARAPIHAAAQGSVKYVGPLEGLGQTIVIAHKDLKKITVYGHLRETFVKQGQVIKQSQKIATMGRIGGKKGGHQLHFEVRNYDKARTSLDPKKLLP